MLEIRPSREGVGRLAGPALVPLVGELLADQLTPVVAFAALADAGHSFLLESVVGGEKWGRYSFIGLEPDVVFRSRGRQVELVRACGVESFEGDPLEALGQLLSSYRPVPSPELPRLWGGAVGYLGYDMVRGIEPIGERNPPDGHYDCVLAVGGTLVVFDSLRQTLQVIALARLDGQIDRAYELASSRIQSVADRLRSAQRLRQIDTSRLGAPEPPASSTFDQGGFERAVRAAQEYIRAGDVIQVVLSQRLSVPRGSTDPFDVYRMLRVVNPSPYMYYLNFPEARVIGASPEVMVRRTGPHVELRPIAGTRRRGDSDEEDARLAQELLADPKERAEHVMLLDLGRNDVGRISVPGGVEVTDRMVLERYSHVMHLVSHVRGRLRPEVGPVDVIRATFPAGTLSGAPKVRAMQIIEALEPVRRGIYGGAVGYIGFDGNLDLAIAIRTIVAHEDRFEAQAGAGIVYDSDPTAEYQETVSKARAPLTAIAAAR